MQDKNLNSSDEMENYINLEKRKFAYRLYFESDNLYKAIKAGCRYLGISRKQFLMYVREYIDTIYDKEDFAIVFQKLITFETTEEIIEYLDEQDLSIEYLESKILTYIMEYRPDILFTKNTLLIDLKKKLKIYSNYIKNKDKRNELPKFVNNDREATLITNFLSSKFSIERFCFQNKITISDFNMKLNRLKSSNPELYLNCQERLNLEKRIKDEEMTKEVFLILNLIKELDNEFNSIDFFINTRHGIKELLKHADKILSNIDAKFFRMNVHAYININMYTDKTLDCILNQKTIDNIDGVLTEVTREDKLEIINFLEENNIPFSNTTFKDATIKYFRNKFNSTKTR